MKDPVLVPLLGLGDTEDLSRVKRRERVDQEE